MKIKFESKVQELDTIIKQLQENNTGIEESIELYKKGIKLYQECSSELENMKLSIKNIYGESLIIE